jgi:hypothetical protein
VHMDAEQAMVEVCQRFCSVTGDAHDDACVALSKALLCAERDERAVLAGLALADRADARADVNRRLVTTDALRAALLAHVGSA